MLTDLDFYSLILDNAHGIFFPEDWLAIDMALSKTEIFGLFVIERSGSLIMSSLAEKLGIPMSTATGIVDRLVREGYILRQRSDSDRRIVSLSLAVRGKEALATMKQTIDRYIERANAALSEEERGQLIRIVLKLLSVFQSSAQPAMAGPATNLQRITID